MARRFNGNGNVNVVGKRRTSQIDDSREKLIAVLPDGTPIHSTVGDTAMTMADKEALSDNLRAAQYQGSIAKMADIVIENGMRFIGKIFEDTAPAHILSAYHEMRGNVVEEWMRRAQFEGFQDGLTTVVRVKGKVVATMPAKIDKFAAHVDKAVRAKVRKMQGVEE